ncbi:MAG: hypothetical protein ABG776_22735 [Cyanobacteria bacterium J06555_13]
MSNNLIARAALGLAALTLTLGPTTPAHAGFGDFIRTIERGQRVYENNREGDRRQEIHDASMEERQQQLELQAERERTANALALEEAEQRREMWNAMTPAQRSDYMEQQEQLAVQREESAMLFTGMIAAAAINAFTQPSCSVVRTSSGDLVEIC